MVLYMDSIIWKDGSYASQYRFALNTNSTNRNISRTCAVTGNATLHLVKPGFPWTTAIKEAGLDYWKLLDIVPRSLDDFFKTSEGDFYFSPPRPGGFIPM